MPVELTPVEMLDIDEEIIEFAPEIYCANCAHWKLGKEQPVCEYWEKETRIQVGMTYKEYLPLGFGTE